jgi:adenylate kinase family enzyme
MQRVVIAGPPCSGKTTLARALSARIGAPHVEVDALWWEPGWVEAGAERLRQRLQTIVAEERWILDGNYFRVGAVDTAYPAADTIVWLDFRRRGTVPRAVRRTNGRALRRTVLCSGNREPIWQAIHVVRLIRLGMRAHPEYNEELARLAEGDGSARWVRLQNPKAVRAWLRSVEHVPPTAQGPL